MAIQEHWLFQFEDTFIQTAAQEHGFSVSARYADEEDPIQPVQKPRGYGGTAIFCRSELGNLGTTDLPWLHSTKSSAWATSKPTCWGGGGDRRARLFWNVIAPYHIKLPDFYPPQMTYSHPNGDSRIDFVLTRPTGANPLPIATRVISANPINTSHHATVAGEITVPNSTGRDQAPPSSDAPRKDLAYEAYIRLVMWSPSTKKATPQTVSTSIAASQSRPSYPKSWSMSYRAASISSRAQCSGSSVKE